MSTWDDFEVVIEPEVKAEVKPRPTKTTTYVVTSTVTFEEYLDAPSWYTPLTPVQVRSCVADISPEKGWAIHGGAYNFEVKKVSIRKRRGGK